MPENGINHAESKNAQLSGRDILFECGQCGKSLAIDCRGAGLNIQCPQCDSELEVPIPDGFDLEALDKEISDSVETVLDVKSNLLAPDKNQDSSEDNGQIAALKTELEALRAQRRYLEQQHVNMLKTIKAVNREVAEFHKALDELTAMLDTLTGSRNDETQRLG
jgi:predicted RNA-binding Zn-ribbon protein involved in translation (DUF1610 family)/uncharacterized coiled-coil protein SlyX